MLNQTVLMGRITKDIEMRYSQGNDMAVARFSLAVDRDYQKQGEEKQTDFINCVAFGKTAEFIEKYFHKGNMLAVIGRIQTGSYTNKDGVKVYTTDVMVDKASFTGEKKADQQQSNNSDGFYNVPDGVEEELPFK